MTNLEKEFTRGIQWLQQNGKEYNEEGDFDSILGGERFEYKTRQVTKNLVFILYESPALVNLIPKNMLYFFEAYNLQEGK